MDLSGDGVADLVMVDQSFLYAFAPYAMSYPVPKILNVIGGRVVDVSTRPAFRRLYLEPMRESGSACRSGDDGLGRNGACAGYVAAAARVGRLDRAWGEMLASYDASADWDLPTGCEVVVPGDEACPSDRQIVAKSYPEALLAFLKQRGYVRSRWLPPEAFTSEPGSVDGEASTT